MAILDSEFLEQQSAFHSVFEDNLKIEICDYIKNPAKYIPNSIYDYVSPLRSLLLEWYPFSDGSSLLEVGGNIGEFTGFLCERCKEVVCIENNESSMKIIKKRCSKYDNLALLNLDINNLESIGKFDYIFVHNIFGFIKKYVKGNNAYCSFFRLLYEHLTDNGKILIAANNRIGLKYISGAIEELSKKMFTGMNDFDSYDKIQTFTKTELVSIFKQADIEYYKFYYPFPNYVFPMEIHTSESLKIFDYGDDDFSTDYVVPDFYDKTKLARTLRQEHCLSQFVNSFLIELSKCPSTDILYYKPNLEDYNHKSGWIIKGNTMADAIIEEIQVSFNREMYSDYKDIHTIQITKTGTTFYWGYKGTLPSQTRLRETLNILIDKIKYHNDENSYKSLCDFWHRIALSSSLLLGLIPKSFQTKRNASESFSYSLDNIYVTSDNEICILMPAKNLNITNNICKFSFWCLLYEWYFKTVYPYKSVKKSIKLEELYEICNITLNEVDEFKTYLKKEYNNVNDKLDILSHTRNNYEMGLLETIDIITKGTLIQRGAEKHRINDEQNIKLLYENNLVEKYRE